MNWDIQDKGAVASIVVNLNIQNQNCCRTSSYRSQVSLKEMKLSTIFLIIDQDIAFLAFYWPINQLINEGPVSEPPDYSCNRQRSRG